MKALPLLILSFIIIPLAVTAIASSSKNVPPLISVRGEGTVTAAPDLATITIGVTSQGKTARDALSQNNQDMDRIMAKMKSLGIESLA